MREQTNLTNEQLRKLLGDIKTIAVVGLSDKSERPAYGVSSYLIRHGYTIIPVNPRGESVFGLQGYKTLSEIPVKIDLVDFFLGGDKIAPVVEEALKLGIDKYWLQEEVVNKEVYDRLVALGKSVIMDACILKVRERLL